MTVPFGRRLADAVRRRGPLCVGLDPHASLLSAWGLTDDVTGLDRFAHTVVDAVAEEVAVVKPQSAFFERHGSRGVAVLEQVVAEARAAGALVIMDAKRGDIGSTAQAYADAYLAPTSPLAADAVTASPYLGFGSLQPLIDTALAHGRGVFVLALTSNPEGVEVQAARGADGRTVAGTILDHLREANRAGRGAGAGPGVEPMGSIGAVVGATSTPAGLDLDIGGPLLAPGIGAQGGRLADLTAVFGPALRLVLPSASRSILRAGPAPRDLRAAATRARDDARTALATPV